VELVSDIDFEHLNIDQNTTFKEFQYSIKSLQKEIQLDFSSIDPFDTFEGNEGEEIALNSELEVIAHMSRQNKG